MRRHLLIGMTLWVALTAGCGSADPQPPSTEADSGALQTDAVTIDAIVDLGTELGRPAVIDVPMEDSTDLGAGTDVDLVVDAAPVVDTGPACEGGQTTCGASCVDTSVDPRHCGSCESDCTTLVGVDPSAVRCVAGRCDLTGACRSERGDCDGMVTNGCETDLTLPASCGSCAASCGGATPICAMVAGDAGAHRACSNGCTPLTPTRCDGTCVDTERDTSHCGACGQACVLSNATATCAGARCTVERCRAGYLNCNGDSADGCEVDGQTAVANCGACARACPGTERGRAVCTAGSCAIVCDAGAHLCDGRCVRDDDPNTCGARCSACPAGPVGSSPVCVAGSCDFACEAGTHRCGSSCASDTSPASCGSSCTPCPSAANADATCETGRCGVRCRTGFADCDGNSANGCEADLSTASTCGACSTRCPTGANASAACSTGRCELRCAAGYGDCDGATANGCEVTFATDTLHCGACGNACIAPPNARSSCEGGTCGYVCLSGYSDCNRSAGDGCELMGPCESTIVAFSDDFERGLGNWVTSRWSLTSTAYRGASALYGYNWDCNGPGRAELVRDVDLSRATAAALEFQEYITYDRASRDDFLIYATADGGLTWQTLGTSGPSGAWRPRSLNLSRFLGSARVRFAFSFFNRCGDDVGVEWRVDDVVVRATVRNF